MRVSSFWIEHSFDACGMHALEMMTKHSSTLGADCMIHAEIDGRCSDHLKAIHVWHIDFSKVDDLLGFMAVEMCACEACLKAAKSDLPGGVP